MLHGDTVQAPCVFFLVENTAREGLFYLYLSFVLFCILLVLVMEGTI